MSEKSTSFSSKSSKRRSRVTKSMTMRASISGTEQRKEDNSDKMYTVYVIDVTRGDYRWRIEHRYSAFLTFYNNIKTTHDLKLSKFPSKTLGLSKLSSKVIDSRIAKLDTILSELASLASNRSNQGIIVDQEFIQFFNLHNIWPPVEKGDAGFVAELIEYEGVDPNTKKKDEDWHLIHEAAQQNHLELLKVLLDFSADTEVQTASGDTALTLATARGWEDAVQVLVQEGAQLDHVNNEGFAAIHLAIRNGNNVIAQLLIDGYCDLNLETKDGEWALSMAVENNMMDLVESLVNAHADPNFLSSAGNTAMHLAVENPELDPITEMLIKKGGEPSVRDNFNWTPMHRAIHAGNDTIMQFLIESGADINAQTSTGESPLMLACKECDQTFVKILVQAGANCNVQGDDGQTALHIACEEQDLEICKYLLANAPVDITITNKRMQSVLHVVARLAKEEFVKLFVKHVLKSGHINIFDAKDNENSTFLMYLCNHDTIDQLIICSIIEAGVDVKPANIDGFTALHLATDMGLMDVVPLMLENGANVNSQSDSGISPLHIAARKADIRLVQILLDQGAAVSLVTAEGDSPLHFAAVTNDQDVCQLLVDHGADPKLKGGGKKTPINLAKEANGGSKPAWAKK